MSDKNLPQHDGAILIANKPWHDMIGSDYCADGHFVLYRDGNLWYGDDADGILDSEIHPDTWQELVPAPSDPLTDNRPWKDLDGPIVEGMYLRSFTDDDTVVEGRAKYLFSDGWWTAHGGRLTKPARFNGGWKTQYLPEPAPARETVTLTPEFGDVLTDVKFAYGTVVFHGKVVFDGKYWTAKGYQYITADIKSCTHPTHGRLTHDRDNVFYKEDTK